jgi:ketosteroid isomerase-like protein
LKEVSFMKKLGFALLAISMFAVSGCVKKVDVEAERTAIRTADAAWSTAIGTKSTDEFMTLVAADATILPPNGPAVTGTDAITAWATEMMGLPGFSVSWEPTTVEVAASGDVGYTVGAYQAQMPMPDGTSSPDRGKYTTIWKKQADGLWKVAVDIFNSDLPLPMPEAAPTDTTGARGQ